MLPRRSIWRVAIFAAFLALCGSFTAPASADVINLSLNVFYTNSGASNSGGTWELVGKSDGSGLFGVQALLTNISSATLAGPRGVVNGSDPAGMWIFATTPKAGYTDVTVGQADITPLPPGDEQSLFYGMGTLINGAPNYAGKPAGTNSIGPLINTLTNVVGVPWANSNTFGDPAWATGVRLASGTFAPGVTPGFFTDGTNFSKGNTFTSTGTAVQAGNISADIIATLNVVRTNLVPVPNADYNHNGLVDAADFVVWRNTLNSNSVLDADGNNSGSIDPGDYQIWRQNFGSPAPSAAFASATLAPGLVPEPSAAMLLAMGGASIFWRRNGLARRRRQGC